MRPYEVMAIFEATTEPGGQRLGHEVYSPGQQHQESSEPRRADSRNPGHAASKQRPEQQTDHGIPETRPGHDCRRRQIAEAHRHHGQEGHGNEK